MSFVVGSREYGEVQSGGYRQLPEDLPQVEIDGVRSRAARLLVMQLRYPTEERKPGGDGELDTSASVLVPADNDGGFLAVPSDRKQRLDLRSLLSVREEGTSHGLSSGRPGDIAIGARMGSAVPTVNISLIAAKWLAH
jgi:hypothetical protein